MFTTSLTSYNVTVLRLFFLCLRPQGMSCLLLLLRIFSGKQWKQKDRFDIFVDDNRTDRTSIERLQLTVMQLTKVGNIWPHFSSENISNRFLSILLFSLHHWNAFDSKLIPLNFNPLHYRHFFSHHRHHHQIMIKLSLSSS